MGVGRRVASNPELTLLVTQFVYELLGQRMSTAVRPDYWAVLRKFVRENFPRFKKFMSTCAPARSIQVTEVIALPRHLSRRLSKFISFHHLIHQLYHGVRSPITFKTERNPVQSSSESQ